MSTIQDSSKVLDTFRRKGKAWYIATELQSDLIVEVDGVIFHLHKFPLLSRSGRLNKLVFESRDTEKDHIKLVGLPGGPEAFELAAKFCYVSINVDITPSNVAALRCAAEYLEMTEDLEEENLISKTEAFLSYIVLASWWDSITVLQTCAGLSPWAENLNIVQRCVESISWKVSTDPSRVRWPYTVRDKTYLTATPNPDVISADMEIHVPRSPAKLGRGPEEEVIPWPENGSKLHWDRNIHAEAVQLEIQKLRADFTNLQNFCTNLQQQLEKFSGKNTVLSWLNSGLKKINRASKAPFSLSVNYYRGEDEGSSETEANAVLSTSQLKNGNLKPIKWRRNSI